MFSRFLAGTFALILVVQPALASFTDVDSDHPHAAAIEKLQAEGIGSGDRFYPDRPVTLAEMLAMGFVLAGRDADELPQGAPARFVDVQTGTWFTPFVAEAERFNLLADYPDRLLPNRSLTRGEAVKLGLGIFGFAPPVSILEEEFGFRDVRTTHRLAPHIFHALKIGVVDPRSDERFGAAERMTRGEAADLLVHLSEKNHGGETRLIIRSGGGADLPKINLLESVWGRIQDDYLFISDVDEDVLMHAAIEGAVEALGDRYSTFLTPEENRSFNDDLSGELEGIGAYLTTDEQTDEIVVVSPLRGSPAMAAGVRPGDVIVGVDGLVIQGMTLQEVTSRIKGPAGTDVTITFRRDGHELNITITRAQITVSSVELSFEGDIAVIEVNQFGGTTEKEFADAVEEVRQRTTRGVVLDLRNNPGGLLDTAVDMLGYFLLDGRVAAIAAYRDGREEIYTVPGKTEGLHDRPVIVLTNEGSASASEIVAAALQDNEIAEIVGTQSFGKGTVQELIFYRDGTALKLTIAHWLSPLRQPIDGAGVTPDIEVTAEPTEDSDPALEEALRMLRGR